jgi:hypothetical protein
VGKGSGLIDLFLADYNRHVLDGHLGGWAFLGRLVRLLVDGGKGQFFLAPGVGGGVVD